MRRFRPPVPGAALAVLAVVAFAAARAPAADSGSGDDPVLVGAVGRAEIEAVVPGWVAATVDAPIDDEAAAGLASVEPGARVTVLFGTWCSDSRREVPRLWRALDQVGGLVPFEIEYIAVDEAKEEPSELVAGRDLRFVPTFIVSRGGDEVGRVVEVSPNGIERDLLALLGGRASGLVTAREDL